MGGEKRGWLGICLKILKSSQRKEEPVKKSDEYRSKGGKVVCQIFVHPKQNTDHIGTYPPSSGRGKIGIRGEPEIAGKKGEEQKVPFQRSREKGAQSVWGANGRRGGRQVHHFSGPCKRGGKKEREDDRVPPKKI